MFFRVKFAILGTIFIKQKKMARFGFEEEQIEKWKDKSRLLPGGGNAVVVLIHGWSAMPRQLIPIAKDLNKRGYWISLPMLKGHGESPEKMENVTANDWYKDVAWEVKKLRKNKNIKKIFVGGVSMGGSLALLLSTRTKIDGVILIGTPVHLKNHFWIWVGSKILPLFKKYGVKNYPKSIHEGSLVDTSYQYFPIKSVRECLSIIRRAAFELNKVTSPILVMQTNQDYLVTKYSPWLIFNAVRSKFKRMYWIKTKYNSHVLVKNEMQDCASAIDNFIIGLSGKKDTR